MLERVLALKTPVVSFHFGVPERSVLKALHDAGTYVIGCATHVKEAQLLEQGGVDAIIAQGVEAGGHRGTFAVPYHHGELGLLALLPQVVDAVSLPVIAAGGISDGRGVAAALTLGAAAVQLGTAFLATPEAALDPIYRRTLLEPRAAETRLTKLLTGRPARAIATRYIDEMREHEDEVLEYPLQRALSLQLAKASLARDSPEFHIMWAGQNASRLRTSPAAQLLETLAAESSEALRAGQSRLGA
jgi:nitronate monooxygenase